MRTRGKAMEQMEKCAILSISLLLTTGLSVSSALPSMLNYYEGYSASQVELLLSVPAIPSIITIIFSAWLASHIKERILVITGLLLSGISGIVPFFNQGYSVVLISRIVFGFGIGLINAKAISMISERYTGEEQTKLLGFRSSMEVLGNAGATFIAGRLLVPGWHRAFLVYVLAFIILALYMIFVGDAYPQTVFIKAEVEKTDGGQVRKIILFSLCGLFLVSVNVSDTMQIPLLVTRKIGGTEQEASVMLTVMMLSGAFSGLLFGKLSKGLKRFLPGVAMFGMAGGMTCIAFTEGILLLTIGTVLLGFSYTTVLTSVFSGLSRAFTENTLNTATSSVLVGCSVGAVLSQEILKGIGSFDASADAPFKVFEIVLLAAGAVMIACGLKRN